MSQKYVRSFFDRRSSKYDNEWYRIGFQEYYDWCLKPVMEAISGKDVVLDLGCGTGYFSESCSKVAREVVAVDFSTKMVFVASRKRDRSITFVVANAAFLPFRDETFQVVCSLDMLQHIESRSRTNIIEEVSRVLASSGIAVFDTSNLFTLLLPRLILHHGLRFMLERYVVASSGLYLYFFLPMELYELFRKGGFRKVRVHGTRVLWDWFMRYFNLARLPIFLAVEQVFAALPLLSLVGCHTRIWAYK